MIKRFLVTCASCGEDRNVNYSMFRYITRGVYSGKCRDCAQKGHSNTRPWYKHSEETKRKIGEANAIALKGRKFLHLYTPEAREKIVQKLTGRKLSPEHIEKTRLGHLGKKLSLEHRIKLSDATRGSKCHFWRGGITSINQLIRRSLKYRLWRESVFKRDDYTCQFCNVRGGKLHADHIKPFSLFRELRFVLENGRTLCVECHRKTDTWGSKALSYQEA